MSQQRLDRVAPSLEAEEEPAQWPPCSRCTVREAKPGALCPMTEEMNPFRVRLCPWVLDGDGRIAAP
jgi:hypothetical protein